MFGITQNPYTNYMIVIEYADDKGLINYLKYGVCKKCNQINIRSLMSNLQFKKISTIF